MGSEVAPADGSRPVTDCAGRGSDRNPAPPARSITGLARDGGGRVRRVSPHREPYLTGPAPLLRVPTWTQVPSQQRDGLSLTLFRLMGLLILDGPDLCHDRSGLWRDEQLGVLARRWGDPDRGARTGGTADCPFDARVGALSPPALACVRSRTAARSLGPRRVPGLVCARPSRL